MKNIQGPVPRAPRRATRPLRRSVYCACSVGRRVLMTQVKAFKNTEEKRIIYEFQSYQLMNCFLKVCFELFKIIKL